MADPTATSTTAAKDHILTLKVMRLTRPKLTNGSPLYMEPTEPGYAQMLESQLKLHGETLQSMTGVQLLLPQSFENIYLGETFTFYVCLHNDSDVIAEQVCIKADLQTTTQRVSLPNTYHEPTHVLKPSANLSAVVSHEIKDIGQHILVCAVSYVTPSGDKLNFRKFFKFPVAKPLDVRTKFYNAEWNDVYFEAQIENLTHQPIVMEKVVLDPSPLYTCTKIGKEETAGDKTTETAEAILMRNPSFIAPKDVKQYLFRLTATSDDETAYKGVTIIGKLDMVWRSSMGERGRLQTSPLQRMAPGCGDIRFTVIDAPSKCIVEQLIDVRCRVTNCSEREVDLKMILEDGHSPALIWCNNVSGAPLARLSPKSSHDCTLHILPCASGLHTIAGVRLVDTLTNRTYEYDECATLHVLSH